ncbi:unnamed protein product, partial [Scytosiphon promiscuus]
MLTRLGLPLLPLLLLLVLWSCCPSCSFSSSIRCPKHGCGTSGTSRRGCGPERAIIRHAFIAWGTGTGTNRPTAAATAIAISRAGRRCVTGCRHGCNFSDCDDGDGGRSRRA